MNHRLPSIILLVLLSCQILYAQDKLVYESGGELIQEQAAYDVFHYDIDLKINPSDSSLAGTVQIQADVVHPTDVIVVDLDPRFVIDSVRNLSNADNSYSETGSPKRKPSGNVFSKEAGPYNRHMELIREGGTGGGTPGKEHLNRELAYKTTSKEIAELNFTTSDLSKRVYIHFPKTLQPGDQLNVEVTYHGKPIVAANPPWDGGFTWETTPSGDPWIGVTSQTIGAWVWWPNKDHPSDKPDSVSLNFTLPEELTVASNGRLLGTSEAGEGWKTWHWFSSLPISSYNVTFNAAPYKMISDRYESISGDEMDVIFWILPEFLEEGRELFSQFPEQIRFLEELLGPYPFRADKYGVVHAPYLGMEHQTLIAYGASFENDNLFGAAAGFDDLHQHELSHEWWGNMVTAWDWRDFWLHEGFGTYMQALYAEHLGGSESYQRMMRIFRQSIRSEKEVAPRESKTTVGVYGSGRGGDIYYKGAWVLHTLRYLIGDEHFFTSLRRFAYPETEDETVKDGSHIRFAATDDYLELVNHLTGRDLDWFFEAYLRTPELPVLKKVRNGDQLTVKWDIPGEEDFPIPVELIIDGKKREVTPGGEAVVLTVPPGAEVSIDPDSWILMEVEK